MNWLKFILIVLGILFGAWLIFSLVGFITILLWYLLVIGIIGVGGYVAYKLFKSDSKQIESKISPSQIQMGIDENEKLLEEMKRKYLEK